MKTPRDQRDWVKIAKALGWSVEYSRNGHLRWRSPLGMVVFTPSTPSDYRSHKNTRAQLRRAGLTI